MPVTQRDVAREAGVSISTVSRVIRNASYVDATTRETVLDAIRKLHYRPNPAARHLKYGRTYTIGFVINDIANPFFSQAVIGAEGYLSLEAPEFELFLVNANHDPHREVRAIEVMLSKRIEGMILASTAAQECIEAVRHVVTDHHIPIVSIDNQLGGHELGVVSADNQLGAYQLTHHLLQHGHRRIGIIAGPAEESHACKRVEGCKQALNDFGLEPDEQLLAIGNWSFEDGHRITRNWLDLDHPPTAIFSSNNFMCMGALYAIRERKLGVPDDIAIVSFDDVMFGDLLRPRLTRLDYDWQKIGEEAARLVLEGIRMNVRQGEPKRIRVPVRLLIRESCGCDTESHRVSQDECSPTQAQEERRCSTHINTTVLY